MTYFLTGCCPACNIVFERVKKAAAEFGNQVVFITVNTMDRETYLAWGAQNEPYIKDKQASYGSLLSYQKINKLIRKYVRNL